MSIAFAVCAVVYLFIDPERALVCAVLSVAAAIEFRRRGGR